MNPSTMTTQGEMIQLALKYQAMGLPIIPLCSYDHTNMSDKHTNICKAPGKAPLVPNWTSLDVPSIEQVKQWYTQWPNANIGLILGDHGEYNLVGIDIDGAVGEELLEEQSQGVLPPTWEFKTGNGRRLIYMLPENAESKKRALKGENGELAFLGTGQQTVLPPSIHYSKSIYEWTNSPEDIEIADAPQWLLNLSLVQSGETPPPTVTTDDWNKTVGKGERNNHLVKLAGSLIARRNIPKQQVIQFLRTWNEQNCDPPLPDVEIITMVENLHEVEQSKATGKGTKKKSTDKSVLRPMPFAEHFVEVQEKSGILWKYSVEKGMFYRCDISTGPWELYDTLYLQREIRKELIEQDPGWDANRNVSEVVSALKELLADERAEDLFDIGRAPNIKTIDLQNGTLDWKKGTLDKWDATKFSTVKLPVVWDPDAKDSKEYQEWLNTLKSWLPDEGSIAFLQEYIGYCLVPDASFRTAVFLYGAGSNGKSLFLDIISKMFEGYISFVPLHWIGERFETSKLIDKLINVCGDIDSKYMTETSTLKAMIAGDPIRAEFKHGKSFHIHPVARLMFSANQLPRSSDKSEGWYSRWKFIEFPYRFKTNTNFKRQLLATFGTQKGLSALLYWGVEGLRRLHEKEEFTVGEAMEQSEKQYRMDNDSVQAFIDGCFIQAGHIGKDTALSIPSVYTMYRAWIEDHGLKPVAQHEFTRRCGALDIPKGVRQLKGLSTNCFLGLLFTEEAIDNGYQDEYNFNESIRTSAAKNRISR